MARSIAVIVGSLRKGSFSRKIAEALKTRPEAGLAFEIVEIGDLPLYNEDVEAAGAPAAWTRFRQAVAGKDGVLFITPEYNRSVPGGMKNAIDVGSRPYGHSVWKGKPGAVISSSPGAIGGFGANHHLRQSLVFLDVPVMQQPEMYLNQIHTWFDEGGALKDEKSGQFLDTFLKAYAAWVETHAT